MLLHDRGSRSRFRGESCEWHRRDNKMIVSGARPSSGSSINNSIRLLIKAQPMLSVCCSPPDNCWPPFLRRSARRGKSRRSARGSKSRSARPSKRQAVSRPQDFPRRIEGKVPLLRYEADAEPRANMARRGIDLPPLKHDPPRSVIGSAGDRRKECRFAELHCGRGRPRFRRRQYTEI